MVCPLKVQPFSGTGKVNVTCAFPGAGVFLDIGAVVENILVSAVIENGLVSTGVVAASLKHSSGNFCPSAASFSLCIIFVEQSIRSLELADAFAFLCALEEGGLLVPFTSSFVLAPVVLRDPGGLLSSSPIESVGGAAAPHTAAFGWFNSTTFEMTNCQTTKR